MSQASALSDQQPAPSLATLQSLVAEDMGRVNDTILKYMDSRVPLVQELAKHVITAGGKRLRPMLTCASARLLGTPTEEAISLAATVEFIHTATLVHDDVIDESDMRRGQESANHVWGNQASVLVGDFLFSRAFQLMITAGSLEILKILSDASAQIAEGEVLQLSTQHNLDTTTEMYYQVVQDKTSALFSAAMDVGIRIVGGSDEQIKAVQDYGFYMGQAFQVMDDVLDYSANQAKLGKSVGDDFAEGKVTLPLIHLAQKVRGEEAEFLARTVTNHDQQAGDFESVQALMQKYGILEACMEEAYAFCDQGKAALDVLSPSDARDALLETADFFVRRDF